MMVNFNKNIVEFIAISVACFEGIVKCNLSKFFLSALTLVLLISFYSSASMAQGIPIKDKNQKSIDNGYAKGHEKRMKQLNLIESELNSFNTIIPNPTPDEVKWVETEENEIAQIDDKTGSRDREGRLVTSIPYTEQKAKMLLNSALLWAKKIRQAPTVDEEMVYWTQLAAIIIDSSTLTSSLDALVKIPEQTRRPYYLEAAFMSEEGRAILKRIVTPYLCSVSQKIMKNPSFCPAVFLDDYT